MKYTTHDNITILLYWLTFFILGTCLPIAFIMGKLICLLSLIIIPIIYIHVNYLKAKCSNKKCNGASLERKTTIKILTTIFGGGYKTTYSCNKCGRVNNVNGSVENIYD